jgi:hypothetical protein
MSITLELTTEEIAMLKRLTKLDDDADAVAKAAPEFVRLFGLRELKGVSGKLEFEDNWRQAADLELLDSHWPR